MWSPLLYVHSLHCFDGKRSLHISINALFTFSFLCHYCWVYLLIALHSLEILFSNLRTHRKITLVPERQLQFLVLLTILYLPTSNTLLLLSTKVSKIIILPCRRNSSVFINVVFIKYKAWFTSDLVTCLFCYDEFVTAWIFINFILCKHNCQCKSSIYID